jgi:signal transduction histidine kinase
MPGPSPTLIRPATSQEDCPVHLNADSLHDLMSPVNQICTMTDLVLHRPGRILDDESKVLLDYVHQSADRLQNLLSGLRTYMRVVGSRSFYRRCDANSLLAGAVASIEPAIRANDAVVTHDPLPEIYCDPNQIVYTLAGLVENAIRFRSGLSPRVHVSAACDGDSWLFSVCDNGIGIDPVYKERIFAMFKRVDNLASPGPGVGLAIVRQVIEQHGGRVWVESQPGFGATFHFTLPRDALQS